ncbi:hypothetical protein SASPL_151129 [Salvia splendens]|uniref:Uncharacterized protein n=1 Tax=Salvia splendens TaxID=180675 RepID=A0A8X8Z3G1_SALSN|nr:hypothetical protein SASPL_151129 [Salvia splendens]
MMLTSGSRFRQSRRAGHHRLVGEISCVRADFTDEAESESQIWGNVYVVRPKTGGSNAKSVSVGTFTVHENDNNTLIPLSCLINKNSALSAMPNQAQIEAVFASYAPYIYFHPDEKYLPSSVNWYFSNGALLYKKGEESKPVAVLPEGSNLPQGGTNDGLYWLDLPAEPNGSRVKFGDLPSAVAYLHFKPVLGGSYDTVEELKNAGKFLPPFLKKQLAKLVNGLPPEVFGEDGPIGPKMKNNWDGDEK